MIQVLIAPIAVFAFGLAVGHGPVHHDNGYGHAGHGGFFDDGIVMFTDAGFRGEALVTDESIRNLRRFDFNDDISSMFIPRGFEVTFYGKKAFRGRSFTVEGPARIRRLDRRWNDRISSIEIVEVCGVTHPWWYEKYGNDRDDRSSVDRPKKRRNTRRDVAQNRSGKGKRQNK